MELKLSTIVKNAGILVGGIAAVGLLWGALDLIVANKLLLIILGIGALAYFVGAWLKRMGK